MVWDKQRKVRTEYSGDSIRGECEASLRRLQVSAIDLYQMHWPPADNGPGLEEAWQTMAGLQKEGKVRWIGVSNFTVAQIERAEKIAPVISPPARTKPQQLLPQHAGPWRELQGGLLPSQISITSLPTRKTTRRRAWNGWARNSNAARITP